MFYAKACESEVTPRPAINVDFADAGDYEGHVRLMGIGRASGENRAVEAAKTRSRVRCWSFHEPRHTFAITGSGNLGMHEVGKAKLLPATSGAKVIFAQWLMIIWKMKSESR